jgi:hypothetical protein
MKWFKGVLYNHEKSGGPTNRINGIVSSSKVEFEEF